jgi:hypothetical protein
MVFNRDRCQFSFLSLSEKFLSAPAAMENAMTRCGMIQRLVHALRSINWLPEMRLSLVVNPAVIGEPDRLRHRMVLGGKVIDLIRETKTSTKEATK